MMPLNLKEFLLDSNLIEGIDVHESSLEYFWENPYGEFATLNERHARNSCLALRQAIEWSGNFLSDHIICRLHLSQMDGFLSPSTAGKYRTCRVTVGGDSCPDPRAIPSLIRDYIQLYNKNTWSANRLHFEFETIHPFIDGNGRTGRLIYAMDLLRRGGTIKSILSEFAGDGVDFYQARARYYEAIRFHKHSLASLS